jgi:aminoglycoside phosphotransferase (APT) family kinase protein
MTGARPSQVDLVDVGLRASRAVGSVVTDIASIPGGRSSLTYSAKASGATVTQVVLKVAPPGLPAVRNRDVVRQARAIQALTGTAVAVPQILGIDDGAPPEVPPLFVMSFVHGESYEPLVADAPPTVPPSDIASRAYGAVSMLVALQTIDLSGDAFRYEETLTPAMELHRWQRVFTKVDTSLRSIATACHEHLVDHIPESLPPVLQHGDWRLGNMQCEGDRINAVIDWEIWSLGDPRMDLAWYMLLADPDRPDAQQGSNGMPGPAELLARYENLQGTKLKDIRWFSALARYKQAASLALIVSNQRRSGVPEDSLRETTRLVPDLLEWCLEGTT